MGEVIMIDIMTTLIALVFSYFAVKAIWVSTIMLDERKKRYKAGTHDYYGNKISEDNT
jgi:hypothetical protein